MPAELMERPRRGTGRTRSRAGRREEGIPPSGAPPQLQMHAGTERSRAGPERSPLPWLGRDPLAPGLRRPSLPDRPAGWKRGCLFQCLPLTERR